VLTELSAYAGRQAANACRAPGNRNLAAWGEARRLLHGVKLNISTLAQKKLPVARCLERATI
jgi:hypothetical protein